MLTKEQLKSRKILKEFLQFVKEYKIVGLGLAFVMGTASTSLIKSLVDDIIMPLVSPLFFGDSWRTATLEIGPVILRWGSFTAELLNFTILAFIVFLIVKKILKEENFTKK